MSSITHRKPKGTGIALGMLAGTAFMLLLAGALITGAKAADKGGKAAPATTSVPVASGYTGCGVGLHASRVNADADFGAPINIGANGFSAGVSALCDVAFDRLVLGAFIDYDRVWGDLHTIGVDSLLSIGARGGVLVTQATLLYAHVGWNRADISGGGSNIDGYFGGLGTEVRLQGTPVSLDLRWTHREFADVMGSSIDASTDEFRLGLVYKFFATR